MKVPILSSHPVEVEIYLYINLYIQYILYIVTNASDRKKLTPWPLDDINVAYLGDSLS